MYVRYTYSSHVYFYNLTIEIMAKWWTTHWMSRSRLYRIYRWVVERCKNKNNHRCKNYWYRWIKCLWKSFEDFYKDMWDSYNEHINRYWEKETTLDRIDVNWNYCKENCRWATQKEQMNNMRYNVPIRYNWKEYPSIMLLCEDLWLKYVTLYKRIFLDWQTPKKAISEMLEKKTKFKYKWIIYKWITDMCRKLNLKRTSIWYRLSIGMTIEEAIEKSFLDKHKEDK